MEQRNIPVSGEFYRHFKGNLYQIIAIATHSETREQLVIYQALYGNFGIYARPLSMFLSEVDHSKYPDAGQIFRFEKVSPTQPISDDIQVEMSEQIPHSPALNMPDHSEYVKPVVNISNTATGALLNDDDIFKKRHFELQSAEELFHEFLDTDKFTEKRNILRAAAPKLTRNMVNTIAMSLDIIPEEKDLEDDIRRIDEYISTRIHFEGRASDQR